MRPKIRPKIAPKIGGKFGGIVWLHVVPPKMWSHKLGQKTKKQLVKIPSEFSAKLCYVTFTY